MVYRNKPILEKKLANDAVMKFQYHKIVKMLRKVGHVYLLHHISISNTSLTDWNLNESCGI